ncbi:contact-dependent growth inhibition system immunity protein [Cellulomonas sp. URHD0024]|uniref:contact-dependent growth inhibition system immunity protein n=1 Tax=Cellulomonas sp. URHD0024 TaxID=1302620 RepID=UPI000420A9C8|nr:contact-dependent growth inhibition system immunity protein [Cellulomonas sp. URHD0024]
MRDVPPELAALTLDQADPPSWGPTPDDATTLVRRVHRLRTVPVAQLGVEDLRLLVAQDVARELLVPLAVAMLRDRPLLEGDYYPGDLLMAVLRVPEAHWAAHPDRLAALREVLDRLDPEDPDYPTFDDDELETAIARARAW